MRNLKKFLALALAMVMAFSLMLTVNAKDVVTEFGDRDQVTAEFKEAVDVLSGMKVFQGDEGGFRPGDTITRAEVAAIIYRMATGDTGTDKMDLYTTTHPFTDVSADDWFAGYVGYCWNAGYIKGTTATTFNPYDNVTGYEVLAMILRAMGYDANNEFTGAQWIVNVSATAQQRGLLADVKTTHYGNTLHLASRRDVVASILFQAAQKTRVKYTPAFGYQSGDFTSNTPEDPNNYNEYTPLGRMNFGLTSTYRMVLGNQATGEKSTILGVRVENNSDSVSDGQKANTATVNADVGTKNVDISYAYPGSVVGVIGDDATEVTVTGTLKVNAKTGLDLFGHKVKVWYDYRDQNSDGIRDNAYAILDKSSLAALVHTTSEDEHSAKLSVATNAEKNNAKLGIAAQKAGFKVDLTDSDAYISDNFSRIQGVSEDALAAAAGNRVGNFAPTEDIILGSVNDMYVLISNNSDKKVDVVIPVSADVARITRKDTVSSVKTLTLGCGDNGIFSRFDVDATVEDGKITDITAGDDGIIAADSVVDGSTTTLGDKVAAWMVLGTNNKALYTDDRKDTLGNKGTYSNDNPGNVMYYLDKLEQTKTGTVRTFGADKSITLTDGTVIEQSWFRYKFDNSEERYEDKADNDFVVGKDGTSNETFFYPDAFEVGKTYTVALDNEGRWLGVTSEASSFIYATFGDYQIGDLGTGTIKYTVTGINWNGEKVINSEVKAINMGVDATWKDDGDVEITDLNNYTWNVIPKNYLHFPNTTHKYALGVGYNLLPFTKKDLGNGSLVITGNQIQAGMNTGTMLSSDGTLDVSTLVSDVNAQPVSTHNVDGERISSLSKTNPNQWAKWGVDEDDVKNGFVDVYGDGMCLLTNDTKFIVVSGTGSATLDAKVYNGLAEFLGDNQSVRLETRVKGGDGDDASDPLYKHVSYIKTDIDEYNRVDGQTGTNENRKVTHVIMSKDDLTYTSGSSLYFAAPLSKADGTGVKLAGTDPDEVKQFELWNNGEKGTYFVDLTLGDAGEDAGKPYTEDTDQDTTGRFIQLAPDREVNGVTVYRTKAVSHGSYKVHGTVGDVGLIFWYTGNNNMATATVEKSGGAGYREVLNVSGAKVVDVKYDSVTCDHDEINSMALLNAIVSGDYARYQQNDTIKVAVAHDGVNVPVIYVTHVPECPTLTGHDTPD